MNTRLDLYTWGDRQMTPGHSSLSPEGAWTVETSALLRAKGLFLCLLYRRSSHHVGTTYMTDGPLLALFQKIVGSCAISRILQVLSISTRGSNEASISPKRTCGIVEKIPQAHHYLHLRRFESSRRLHIEPVLFLDAVYALS